MEQIVYEDVFFLDRGRLQRVGARPVAPYERDPDKLWVGSSQWYLDLQTFTLAHEGEGLRTLYTADPSVLLHTSLVNFGENTPEGCLLKSPTAAWFEISNHLLADPDFRFEFCTHAVKFEHFLAASHHIEGWESVTITPRSGDKGRDVIAEDASDRILHEAKAYNERRLVKAEQVRALYGVWNLDPVATQAIITTTADFAPGIREEFGQVIPEALQIINGSQFVQHVGALTATKSAALLSAELFKAAGVQTIADDEGRNVPLRKLITYEQLRGSID